MTKTMMDYIVKQRKTNLQIFNNRKKLLNNFLSQVKDLNFSRMVVIATGSSSNAVECARYFVSDLLNVEVTIKMPSVVSSYDKFVDQNAIYLAVSQGGHSSSTIEAVKEIQCKSGNPVYTFTADMESPIAQVSTCPIDIGCGEEEVGFVTMGMSATVLMFMLAALELSFQKEQISSDKYDSLCSGILKMINYIDTVINLTNKWYEYNKNELSEGKKFTTIGYGAGFGVAKEAETKLVETIRRPVVGYELEEYMHGPYLAIDKDSYLIFIENNGVLSKRREQLANYLRDYTSHIFTIQMNGKDSSDDKKILNLQFLIDEHLASLLLIIPIQILSYRLAGDMGIDLSKKIFTDFDSKLKSKV